MRAVIVGVLFAASTAHAAPDFERRTSQNASCVACHPDIAAEWTRSLHQSAWKDPIFQKAYAVEPVAFCRGCHAPESDAAREPEARAKDVGIGCVSCHVDDNGIHATHANDAALHPVTVDASLGTPKLCARCHEFDFPADSHQLHPQPMQDTVAEHARGDRADTPCQTCHMPIVDGHRSHAFSVIDDPRMLRRAATITAERGGNDLRVTLVANQVGHAFPTGDMFRRLEVRARVVDEAGKTVATARPVELERRFEDRPRDPNAVVLDLMRVEAEDTRVPPPGRGARVVTLPLVAAGRIVWTVAYQRMSTPMATAFGLSQVLDEVILAEGSLPSSPLAYAVKGAP